MKRFFLIGLVLILVSVCPAKFLGYLQQSTAYTLKLGPFVDRTDGVTMETALDIDQADVMLSKNNGDFAAKNDATNNAPDDDDGYYEITIDATDTGTLGLLQIKIDVDTAHVPATFEFWIQDAAGFALSKNGVTTTSVATGAIDSDAIADNAIDAGAIAADAITSSELAATAVTEIAAGIASDSTWLAALAAYLNRSCMGI